MLKAALAYAKRGKPVFPCKPGMKEPLTKNGYLDATTDPRQINLWWHRWPQANIGIPTGERSGILVLDVDEWGPGTLDALEEEHGPGEALPETATTKTGGGGMHYLFEYPAEALSTEIRNSAGRLGLGLDVRGEGGYFITPPSQTESPYEWLDRAPIAAAPGWLLALLREIEANRHRRPSTEAIGARLSATAVASLGKGIGLAETSPIPDGERNETLTRIAGRLHDGTRNLAGLDADLQAVNEARCTPPLPGREVSKIAASIHGRKPCKPGPSARVLATVESLGRKCQAREKRGMGAHSNWAVYRALLAGAKRHGREHEHGVEVSIDLRSLAFAAGVGLATAKRRLDALAESGLVIRSRSGGGKRSGALVLIGVIAEHSSTGGGAPVECSTFAPIAESRVYRLRWGPGRLGKIAAAVVEAVAECSGNEATRAEIATFMGRKPDSIKKHLKKLVESGLIERTGHGCYRLVEEFAEAFSREREVSGEVAADRRDLRRYNENREAYRNRYKVRPAAHPANAAADGWVGDLEKLPPAPDLRGRIGQRVRTAQGTGYLWDYKGNEARIVLDADTSRWIPLDPSELILEEVA